MNIRTDDLINALESKNYQERWFAAEIIGTKKITKSDQLKKILMLMMKSDVGEVLCWGLGQMKNKDYINEIGKLLEHSDNYFKWRAMHTLKHLGNKEAIKVLESYLEKSKYSETRRRYAEALGKIGNINSFTILWNAAQDKDRYVRWKSIWAISLLNGNVENRIRKKILDLKTNEYMLWRCLWVLGCVGNKNTKKWLDDLTLVKKHKSKYIKYQLKLTYLSINNKSINKNNL